MGIGIERQADLGMPETLLDYLWMDTLLQH
jgi:hypothetical protein